MSDIISNFPMNDAYDTKALLSEISRSDVPIGGEASAPVSSQVPPSQLVSYWRQQLVDPPAILQLPYDHPRSTTQAFLQGTYTFSLPAQLPSWLDTLGYKQYSPWSSLLLATLAILLHRYTDQDDLLISVPMTTQDSKMTETNIVIIRVHLATHLPFWELLTLVDKTVNAASMHQNLPFPQLVAELQLSGEPDLVPFTQVLCTFQQQGASSAPLAETIKQIQQTLQIAHPVDIGLEVREGPTGLQGSIIYNARLFESDTIERLAGHYQVLLDGIMANPQAQIGTLPLLTPDEEQQLLIDWNAPTLKYPKDQCITDLFEAQAARTPEANALIFGEQYISYHELNRRANQLAQNLKRASVGPETLVGIYMQRSVEMIVALLGILKSGGAYVPLDPAYPAERIEFMVHNAAITTIVTQQRCVGDLPGEIARVICLDSDWSTIAQEPEEKPVTQTKPDNLAYVIYTSGSTGKPKGVAIEHRSTVAFIHWALHTFTPEELAGVIGATSINFDLSIFEIFVPLSCGGTIILVENALHVRELPMSVRATLLNTVPSVANELVYAGKLPASVSTINLAGEPLSSQLVQRLYAYPFVQRVYNLYGPTEDTTYSTYALMERGESEPSIGRPIANTQAYILNTHLQPVPRGVVGELYLSGAGLAREYLNRPDLNAERFVFASFGDYPPIRLYKTGDLVRYRADGTIAYLGRRDHQVKIRGFRIELEEIEEVIRQLSAVRESAVVAWNAPSDQKQLVAYVVVAPEHTLIIDDFRQELLRKLPAYMVPEHFVVLAALPLSPNGKINRQALPAPNLTPQRMAQATSAPSSLTQHRLIELWQDLLGIQQIEITDNFFYLGGNSLLAARLIASIERIFGKKLSFTTLFANPTIAQIAHALEQQEDTSAHFPLVKVQDGSKHPFFYLHGDWSGGAFYCFTLAQAMGAEQPFYAVGPCSYDGVQDPLTLEEMAVAYIASFRALQAEGPYLLGGFCNGGLMAYEIARQLVAQGQHVDLLLLVEPADADFGSTIYAVSKTLSRTLHWSRRQELDMFLRLRHLCKMLQPLQKKRREDIAYLKDIDPRLLTMMPPSEALRKDRVGIFTWASAAYAFPFYAGPITLFWSKNEPFRGIWQRKRERERDISLHMVPGTHMTSVTEHIQVFAERLSRCVNNAQMKKR